MTGPRILWQHVPDVAGRRRLRTTVRFGTLATMVLLLVIGWQLFGVTGGLVALLVMVTATLLVEAWGRSTPETGPQRIWLDMGELCVEGPDVYRRIPGEEAFERDEVDPVDVDVDDDVEDAGDADEPLALPVVDLTDVARASVYPATTRTEGVEGPPVGFHLVVDLTTRDGSRRCIVFDRRIPFRVSGELALVDAVRRVFGDRWHEPPEHDTFGEIDERRLADWRSAS